MATSVVQLDPSEIDPSRVLVSIPPVAPGQPGRTQVAYQNNNPGNLRNSDGSWKTYDKPEDGLRDLEDHIDRHAGKGQTLGEYLAQFAPPKENDTETYIRNAENSLGVLRTTKLSLLDRDKLAAFQAKQESGADVVTNAVTLDPSDIDQPDQVPGPGMHPPQLPVGLAGGPALPSRNAAGQIQSTIPGIAALPPLSEEEYQRRVAGQGPTPEFGLGPTITGGLESALGARSIKTGTTIAGEPISRVKGAAEAISGAVEATTPAMVPGIAAAPLEAAFISGISSLSAEGAQKALQMLNAGEDYQELGSVLGGLGGAALAGFGPRIAGDYLFRRMLRAALQEKVNADFRAREAAEHEANKPKAVEEPPQPKPKKPPEDIQEAEFEDIPTGPKGGPTPAAAEPEPRVTPPVEVAKGNTFETPTGRFTVTDIAKGRVKYEKETPGGQIVPGTLPLSVFQGMIGRLMTPPAAPAPPAAAPAATVEQPAAQPAWQPPATTVQLAPEDVDKTPTVATTPQVAPQAQTQLVPVESVKPGVRRVTGSADAALNEAGKETAAELKKEYAGKFDIVNAGPMSRTQDTAAGIAPQTNIDQRLGPMELGAHEGEEEESQREAIHKRMREAPDEPFPGVSKFTGTPGETTNHFTNDVVEQAQEQRAQLAANPDLKILNVTHGRNMRALEAWAKAGFPEDRSVDMKEMTSDGDHWSEPGDIYQLTDKGMRPLKGDPQGGIYYVRHGETDFSTAKKGGKAASTSAREPEPKPEAPPRPIVEPAGKPAEVYTTKGTRVNVAYDVRESGDLQNSFEDNYPQELQPRDTGRKASRQRVDQRKADMNGALMADSRLASDGAPITLKTGTVVTRNHGTQALKELYAENNPRAAEYKQWLTDHASEFGLDPRKVAGMKEPVLIRVLKDDLPQKEIVKFAEEANAPSTARMSDAEVAASLAKKMTGALMDAFDPTEDGRPNVEFVRELIKDLPVEEQAVFMDRDGKLSQTGARIIRNVVFAKAYPDPRALERMAESESPTLKNLTAGMLAAAPDVAKLQEAVARGDRYDLGLGSEIADAATVMDGLIREGTPLNVWLAQGEMFGRDPAVERLVQVFSENRRSSKRIGGFLKEYTEVAEAAGSPKQVGMFGPPEPPQKIDAIEAAYERAKDKWQAQRDLFAAPGAKSEGGGVAPQEGGAAGPAEDNAPLRARQLSPEDQPDLFGEQAVDQSKADTQHYEDKLLGERLTAQIRSGLPARPAKLKPAKTANMFEETGGPEQEPLFSRRMPGFYSQLENVVDEKMPERASPQQVLSIVSNPQNGVKQDERDWSGIMDWLKEQKGPVTKQQVRDFIQGNRVDVQETFHGSGPENERELAQAKEERARTKETYFAIGRRIETAVKAAGLRDVIPTHAADGERPDMWGEVARYAHGLLGGPGDYPMWARRDLFPAVKQAVPKELIDDYNAAVKADIVNRGKVYDLEQQIKNGSPGKFGSYVTPGGQNYRELLLTLPPTKVSVSWKQTEPDTWVSTAGDAVAGEHGRFEIYDFTKRGKGFKVYDGVRGDDLGEFPSLAAAQERVERLRGRETSYGKTYQSPHWDEPNVLAHVRFNDRTTPDGKRVLHVEEIQSDWHQEGKRKGYRGQSITPSDIEVKFVPGEPPPGHNPDNYPGYWESFDKRDGQMITRHSGRYAEQAVREEALVFGQEKRSEGVPRAPFAKSWPELSFKRMLRYAVENNYDAISWTTGEQQAERYDLSKHVSQVSFKPNENVLAAWDPFGNEVFREEVPAGELERYIGKDAAKKLLDQPEDKGNGYKSIRGLDLKVGGEGMKGFYDQILPAFANKYGNKWGASVGTTQLPEAGRSRGGKLTPHEMAHMRDLLRQEDNLGFDHPEGALLAIVQHPDWQDRWEIESPRLRQLLQDYRAAQRPPITVHSMSVTPAMRESVTQGQPLFQHRRIEEPNFRPWLPASVLIRQAKAYATTVGPQRYPVVFANVQGMDAVIRAAGHGKGLRTPREAAGVTFLPGQGEEILDKLDATPGGSELANVVRQNRNATSDPLVVVYAGRYASDSEITNALNEELDHAAQLKATGAVKAEHVPLEQFYEHPSAQKAAHALRRAGYKAETKSSLALEIGARLMRPGRYGELGLTATEAENLAVHYVDLLDKAHGDKVAEVVDRVYSAFGEQLHGKTRTGEPALIFGRKRGGRQPQETAGTQEAEGRPSGTPGVAPHEWQQSLWRARKAITNQPDLFDELARENFNNADDPSFREFQKQFDLRAREVPVARFVENLPSGQQYTEVRKITPQAFDAFLYTGPYHSLEEFRQAFPDAKYYAIRKSDYGILWRQPLVGKSISQLKPTGAQKVEAFPSPEISPAEVDQSLARSGESVEHNAYPLYSRGERGSLSVPNPNIGRTLKAIGSPSALTRSAVGARTNAIEALRSAMDEPSDRHFGQKIRTFVTGERDLRIAETNQLRDQLREHLPNHVDQEALTLMRDFKNRPGELEQFLDGSHPDYQKIPEVYRKAAIESVQKLRPVIERALDPTPEMHGADEALTHYFREHLAEGRQLGFLDSEIANEEYITHVVQPAEKGEPKKRFGQLFPGKLGPRRFRFGKQRFYPTILHALAGGAKVRTLNALDALGVYGEKYATTAAYHLLLNVLKGSAAGKWGSYAQQRAGAIPADWVELAPESRTFRHEIPFTTQEGTPGVAHQSLFVPPNVEEAMRPILDPNYANRLPGFQRGRVYQAYIKMVQLGLSVFHLKALQLTALGNEGPTGVLATYLSDMKSPEFMDAERSWIRAGLTTPVLGKTMEVYMALRPSSLPTTAENIRNLPIIKQADRLASAVSHLTFGIVQRKMKVVDASLQYAAWLAKHPTATPQGQFEAQRLIAKQVNATYGGLNWENLGINRMTRELARALLLAPDWTYSNVLNLQYAGEGGPAGRAARIFWIRSIIFGLALTAAMSLLMSKRSSKDPTRVLLGKDKEGHDMTDNVFFVGAPGDLSTLLHNVQRYGAPIGLARSIVGKFGPLARTGIHLATGEEATGRPIIPKVSHENILGQRAPAHKPNAVEKTALGVREAVKELAPVPFSVSTIARMLSDQKHHYSMGQYMEAVMSGRQPQAEAATGTR